MQLPLSLPPVLPSHRLGSRATPCHKVPSCAFSGAMLSALAAPGGLMCLWPYLRPHWCHVEGAGTGLAWHWPLFVLYNLSPSLCLWKQCFKSVFAGLCGCAGRRTRKKTQAKHTFAVFPLSHHGLGVVICESNGFVPGCVPVQMSVCRQLHRKSPPRGQQHQGQEQQKRLYI